MPSARCCTRDGIKLRYEIRGAGDPLALIMGFSGSSRTWGEPFLQALERKFSLVLIDNRGTGESDKPDAPITLADLAADAAAILDHADIPRSHAMGISMGGMIAQEYALNFGSRVRGLVLGCTTCGMRNAVMGPPELVNELMPQPGLSPRDQARRSLSACSSAAFVQSDAGRAFIEARLDDMEGYPITPPHTFQRQMDAIMAFDTFDRLKQIKAPTLVITGTGDPLVPAQNSVTLRDGIPDAKLYEIPRAGHLFFWEAPQASADAVAAFLATVK
ncbi:MAG TPA: alpha/beta hydrolase [Candidatus Binataceae bacterium]|nr:alpha/beta hydrolase [Candidatus Binataceae bacterium]